MSSLADVFRVLGRMRDSGIIAEYAIAGATAVLFYAEPTRTYDVDAFVLMPRAEEDLISLSGIYGWAQEQGFTVQAEHILIHGVPVQVIPAYNSLAVDAIKHARTHDYEGVQVNVIDPEHLVALALQAGGARRRERAWQLLQSGAVDRDRLRAVLARHGVEARIPDDV